MSNLPSLQERLADALSQSRRALVVGVGGGDDSVTALLLREQLRSEYKFAPAKLDIAAMMPDFLDYRAYQQTECVNAWRLTPDSERWIQGTRVLGFPEPVLARRADRFGVGEVLGIDMRAGASGVYRALFELIASRGYDLLLAADVGGDFIAAPENVDVLSPMMDGYMLHALRLLGADRPPCRLVGAVFGLGTDGESSPEMLRLALQNVGDYEERAFAPDVAPDVERFYREEVEPNRYSRTADFTLREVRGGDALHAPEEDYRVRYHTRPAPKRRRSYTGAFRHRFDPAFYGRYFLFDDLSGVRNPFAVPCNNGIEWLLRVSTGESGAERVHHELVGQAFLQGALRLLFAIPSRKFTSEDRAGIVADTVDSLQNGVYNAAFAFQDDAAGMVTGPVKAFPAGPHLSLLTCDADDEVLADLLRITEEVAGQVHSKV